MIWDHKHYVTKTKTGCSMITKLFTMLLGSNTSELLSRAALSQPAPPLIGHWLACSFTLPPWWAGHSLTDGTGVLCWTGQPAEGVWVTMATLAPESAATDADEVLPIPIIKRNHWPFIRAAENIYLRVKNPYRRTPAYWKVKRLKSLTLYILTSVCKLSILCSIHFVRCW